MPSAEQIIKEAESLPVEKRAIIVDSLLRTLNPPNSKVDRKWVELAKRRLTELRSGRVKSVPGDMVFAKIRKQFDE